MAEVQESLRDILMAREAITDRHVGELKRGKPVRFIRGTVECPVCEGGELHYTISNLNGHIHAMCKTDGCVRWME